MYQFEVPAPVYFGRDSRLEILPRLEQAGFKKIGIVMDAGVIAQTVFTDYLEKDLPAAGFEISTVYKSRNNGEPDYAYLDESVDAFRGKSYDCILGIGGGSAMDLAKGISILLTNEGKGVDYRGMDLVRKPGVPLVLFPTTAGTGSEVTKTAAFISTKEKKKLGINGRYVSAWAGVLDPMFTLGCPAGPTICAGLDALVHCIESFTAVTSSPLARGIAKNAFPYLFSNLPKVIENPQNIEAREKMLLGSHLAGIALWNAAGGGPASAVSYPVGVFHNVPHGFAGGVLLPYVIEYNVNQGYEGYQPLYGLIEDIDPEPSIGKSSAFVRAFFEMYKKIGAPMDFSGWEIMSENIPTLVEDTIKNRYPNLTHNPIKFDGRDVENLLQRVVIKNVMALSS